MADTAVVREKVYRTELNPVDLLARAAYMYPEQGRGRPRRAPLHLRASSASASWRLANALRDGGPRRRATAWRRCCPNSPGDARGALRRARRPAASSSTVNTRLVERGDRLHPRALRRALPPARRGARRRSSSRSTSAASHVDPRRRHRRAPATRTRTSSRGGVAGAARELARGRGGDDLDQLHVRARPAGRRASSTPTAAPT